ncbi:MAG: hypothetical protein QNJ68_15185 [Microcoleaceae cyanobacterium MO_207.B10]|nr:hypothetical protein [Microcoleaceae cyanobacterium MO_207.B10]
MFHKFDLFLSTSVLVVVTTMGLPLIEVKMNPLKQDYSQSLEDVFLQFLSKSNEQPPVPYKEGTSRG